jgi:Ca2+-binding EF-hand superfamily protein
MFLIVQLSPSEEKARLLQTFKEIDVNNDGKLTREELINGFSKFTNPVLAQAYVHEIMQNVDDDKSGDLDYSGTSSVLTLTRVHPCYNRPHLVPLGFQIGNGFPAHRSRF